MQRRKYKRRDDMTLKVSDAEVRQLRFSYRRGASISDLAIVYGISYAYVRDIVNNYRRVR